MQSNNFELFLQKFPPVAMPVLLGEDEHHTFSTENEPLPEALIAEFILPMETVVEDDFTEFVPCLRIEGTHGFAAIIYWKADLLRYEYVLATFNAKGERIARRTIAKTVVDEEGKITRSVAQIDEELIVFVAEGKSSADVDDFDPTTSKSWNYEILVNGEIIEYNVAMN